jgi:predicted O-methyltransferase YrrM
MLLKILKKILLILSSPLRYIIRYELNRHIKSSKDLGTALQKRATESTADYVEKNMKNVDSISSKLDLLTMALMEVDLQDKRLICEFGVYSGFTINHIASLTKKTVYGFDSFEGLPERWRDNFRKGTFKVNSLPKVKPNVKLIKGLFNETLQKFIKDHEEPIGFLHIDCDLYSSTKDVLQILSEKIHAGCIIVFDEYFNYPGWQEGEFKAFHEFIERTGMSYKYIGYNRHEQVVVKIL